MALRDAIRAATRMGSTQLGAAVKKVSDLSHDRLIVITDEQSHDRVPEPKGLGYMINVASNRNGVGYGKWLHVDGWSDAVVRFISERERADESSE
jgi:60 kDa SS-A/Ro ribonucleoprotein